MNWSKGTDEKGQPIPEVAKEPTTDGVLLNTSVGGGTNWYAPSFDPETGLFYVNANRGYSLAYLTDTDPKPEGYGGSGRQLWSESVLNAIDYQTGKIRWSHPFPGRGVASSGILSTAGKLVFSGDPSGNLIAWEAATGKILWHFHFPAAVGNGPMTFELDGKQHLVVGAGDTLYDFGLLRSDKP